MNADRRQRVRALFDKAAPLSAAERESFLAEACEGDAELQAEVESLLEHDSRADDDFLRPPEPVGLMQLAATDRPDPLIGSRVGSFHIRHVIASGGMGTVYEAVQEQPHRTVALKIMKRNIASPSALRRFQFESQVLGRLRHPNIAQVYQAGMHDDGSGGVPYFAMEYIPGARPVTQFATEKKLGTRDRLRLFAKVCDAVHHGHQKGVIHRDLKPANILVDSASEPKVIDFGVARATDSDLSITTQQTEIGQLLGTMQYMSPEQCDADPHDLDTRSDVYSLGAVLYELLTGELPYETSSTTIYAATRAIKEQTPRRLSSINPRLRGNVETITLKALEKDRDRRYQSAADLARDIHRHLNREPIEARPPSGWARAVHWVARNPVITTAVASLSIAAIVAAATFVVLWSVHARPSKLSFSYNPGDWRRGGEAHLYSFSGADLKTWSRGAGVKVAMLLDRPNELGGGKIVLLGFSDVQSSPFPGSLCVFDANGDLERPLWQRRIDEEDVLPELRLFRSAMAGEFAVQNAWLYDVFPQHPGAEVVVWFRRGIFSQSAIRIYDLRGDLLYQVWCDGVATSCHWMSDAGLLVFAGDCHWPYWDKYGNLLGDRYKDSVVFALRPERGFIANSYLDYLASTPGDDRLNPAWYLRLQPDIALDNVTRRTPIVLWWPEPPYSPGRYVGIGIDVDDRIRTGVTWVVDEFGQRVPNSIVVGDAYKRNQNLADDHPDKIDLPNPADFTLVPMTPADVMPGSTYGSSDTGNDGP